MRAIGLTIKQMCHISSLIKSVLQCYRVKATYIDAKKLKGIRAAIYKNAEIYSAHYSLNGPSIWYNDDCDLHVSLLFREWSHAHGFHTFLSHWQYNNPLVVKRDTILLEENIKEVFVFAQYLNCVHLSDYNYEESSSPTQTLSEFSISSPSYTISECTSMESDLARFQSIEKSSIQISFPYNCHIKPKAQFPLLKNIEFNILAGSWFPFHQFFDGLHTYDEISGALMYH